MIEPGTKSWALLRFQQHRAALPSSTTCQPRCCGGTIRLAGAASRRAHHGRRHAIRCRWIFLRRHGRSRQGQAPDHGCGPPPGPASLPRRPPPTAARAAEIGSRPGRDTVGWTGRHASSSLPGSQRSAVTGACFWPRPIANLSCAPQPVPVAAGLQPWLAPQAFVGPAERVRKGLAAAPLSAAKGGQASFGIGGQGRESYPAQAGRCRGWRRCGGQDRAAASRPSRPAASTAAASR